MLIYSLLLLIGFSLLYCFLLTSGVLVDILDYMPCILNSHFLTKERCLGVAIDFSSVSTSTGI